MAKGQLGRVIAFGNQKGGVGKTTTTINVGAALARMGRTVCLVDVDNNRGLTRTFSIPEGAYNTSFEIFVGAAQVDDCLLGGNFVGLMNGEEITVRLPEGLHVIPASRQLETLDEVVSQQSLEPAPLFARALTRLRSSFDYVFVDTAPNLTTPTVIAYNTVPWFVLTARPGKTAMDSLSDSIDDLLQVRELGAEGRMLGIVLTEVDIRTRLAKEIVQQEFQATLEDGTVLDLRFNNYISKTIAIEEAPFAAQTIFSYKSTSQACAQYEALAEEMEVRLEHFETLFGLGEGAKRAANA